MMGIAVNKSTLETIYTDVLGEYKDEKDFLWKHRGGFVHFIQSAIADGTLSTAYSRKNFKLERLSYALEPARDRLLSPETLENLLQTHLLDSGDGRLLEIPQYYWMRRAMANSVEQPNPTRSALKLYEKYSTEASLTPESFYGPDIFNGQRLLFESTRPVVKAGITEVPNHYIDHGWTVIDGVNDEFEAIRVQERLINSAVCAELLTQEKFRPRVQLAKADQIPVCDDIVATSFQVLHFDMGHPFVESDGQLLVSHVGIYLPKSTTHDVTASTRLVELEGLTSHLKLTPNEIEHRVKNYAQDFGDGWTGHNTFRLAAFVRFLDALSDTPELADQIDKTVGQWFGTELMDEGTAYKLESAFFAKHGIDLGQVEHQVRLEPGQLLLLDNTRVIHGRIGQRRAKELFNFMWGIEQATQDDIATLRKYIAQQAAG